MILMKITILNDGSLNKWNIYVKHIYFIYSNATLIMFKKSHHNFPFANHLKFRKPRRSQMSFEAGPSCRV